MANEIASGLNAGFGGLRLIIGVATGNQKMAADGLDSTEKAVTTAVGGDGPAPATSTQPQQPSPARRPTVVFTDIKPGP